MRLLFVSSTTVGGSGRSQRELAGRLQQRGDAIRFLVDDARPARLTRLAYEQFSDLAVRMKSYPASRLFDWLERRPGRTTEPINIDGWIHDASPIPQNAVESHINEFRPDAVIGNSLERLAWRRIHRICQRLGVPSVLYVREIDSLDHFVHGEVPDLLVANAESLQAALQERGLDCAFVPSVIDMSVTRTNSTRRVALAINPIKSKGSDIVWKIAEAAPDLPIVVQESWPLSGDDLAEAERRAAGHKNIEFRRAVDPGPSLYGDARVLLVPYLVNSRPRVITEAQSNGIPVVAADVRALREAIGGGGTLIAADDITAWVAELRSLWTDTDRYDRLAAIALEHSSRAEIDPDHVAAEFERLLERAVTSHDDLASDDIQP